eukprot:TRINITY_DN22988_c0_g1_i1.p1 TRINITY_DN22988_c0_g1~~TRINITY_DN22988_c0_g1_i1.p1  ORF type:complete len:1147 (+),score=90.07 TRINITY_DN22988_c0_g1_i1:37-3477(+)
MSLAIPRALCDHNATLPPDYSGYDFYDWPPTWLQWPTLLSEMGLLLQNNDDFFRQMNVRRHFKWLLRWYSSVPPWSVWRTSCPVGILALRLFTLLVSNDADRCIQLRDARVAIELLQMPLADVVESGGWVLFNMLGRLADETRRVSFPLDSACDALDVEVDGDAKAHVAYRDKLVWALGEGTVLPEMRFDLEREFACPIVGATMHFALAAESSISDTSARSTNARYRHHMEEGHRYLRSWKPLGHSLYDLITTRWPVWRTLERAARPVSNVAEAPSVVQRNVEAVYCGSAWRGGRDALESSFADRGWKLHFLTADAAACPSFYAEISESMPNDSILVALSPLLWAWEDSVEGVSISTAVELLSNDKAHDVIGFPTLDHTRFWSFNVWKLRREHWSFEYKPFPTGYRKAHGDRCFETEAASGTLVFRSVSAWRTLLDLETESRSFGAYAWGAADWLVHRDLQLQEKGFRVLTCVTSPLREDSHLSEAQLTPALSLYHHKEVATFTPANRQTRCLETQDMQHLRAVSSFGRDAWPSPCLESDARSALRFVSSWWTSMGSGRQLVARWTHDASSALLLTTGAAVLPRTTRLQPLVLEACCEAGVCPLSLPLPRDGLPKELLVELVRTGVSTSVLVFHSMSTSSRVLEVKSCLGVQSSESQARFRLVIPWLIAPLFGAPGNAIGASSVSLEVRPHLLYCYLSAELEAQVRRFAIESGLEMHSLAVTGERTSACVAFLLKEIETIVALRGESAQVVFLSPTMWGWDDNVGRSILLGARSLAQGTLKEEVVGFPTAQRDQSWQWNVRHIRHRYWKLRYSTPGEAAASVIQAGSMQGSSSPCAVGDASSATRVFGSAATLRDLLTRIVTDENPDADMNWLLDLDLLMHAAGLRIRVCATWPVYENDYLQGFSLTTQFGIRHQVESVDILGALSERCLPGSNWFQVAQKGLVAPWCFRRDVTRTFRSVHAWWTSLDPQRNFVIPEEGTFLSLFRNGASGMLPWDSDFDAKLYTEGSLTVGDFMNLTRQPSFLSLELEAYDYKGCGQDSYILLRRPNITHHIGDLYIKGGQPLDASPWRANLFGTVVRVSPAHMDHIFFNRYRTPVRKLFGTDGLPLKCYHPNHNACLPDCTDEGQPCEFEDDFVHVDADGDAMT